MKKMMAMAVTAAMLVMTAVTGCSTPAGNGAGTAGTQTGSEGTQQESQKTADKGGREESNRRIPDDTAI